MSNFLEFNKKFLDPREDIKISKKEIDKNNEIKIKSQKELEEELQVIEKKIEESTERELIEELENKKEKLKNIGTYENVRDLERLKFNTGTEIPRNEFEYNNVIDNKKRKEELEKEIEDKIKKAENIEQIEELEKQKEELRSSNVLKSLKEAVLENRHSPDTENITQEDKDNANYETPKSTREVFRSPDLREEKAINNLALEIFFQRIIPTKGAGTINAASNAIGSAMDFSLDAEFTKMKTQGASALLAAGQGAMGAVSAVSSITYKLKYLTVAEVALLNLINPLLIPFIRNGISIKLKTRSGLKGPIRFSDLREAQNESNFYTKTEGPWTPGSFIRQILKAKNEVNFIGSIQVFPTYVDGGASEAFPIPFQFNPTIGAEGFSVNYESTQKLHRIGEVSSYVNTSPEEISLETSYLITGDERVTRAMIEEDWLGFFTPEKIKSIELAYRGLALPTQSEGKEGEIFFRRPPVIKVQFGEVNSNPILTYPKTLRGENGESLGVVYYYKSFIVTNVSIDKNLEEFPLDIRTKKEDFVSMEDGVAAPSNYKIENLGSQGFKVSLTLKEIDPNYIDTMPTFFDYYSASVKYEGLHKGIHDIVNSNSYEVDDRGFFERIREGADSLRNRITNETNHLNRSLRTIRKGARMVTLGAREFSKDVSLFLGKLSVPAKDQYGLIAPRLDWDGDFSSLDQSIQEHQAAMEEYRQAQDTRRIELERIAEEGMT